MNEHLLRALGLVGCALRDDLDGYLTLIAGISDMYAAGQTIGALTRFGKVMIRNLAAAGGRDPSELLSELALVTATDDA